MYSTEAKPHPVQESQEEEHNAMTPTDTYILLVVVFECVCLLIEDKLPLQELLVLFSPLPQVALLTALQVRLFVNVDKLEALVLGADPLLPQYTETRAGVTTQQEHSVSDGHIFCQLSTIPVLPS